ncbi:hypothetical protein [Saccharomonospora cyanea]|uniref:DUF3168 domain-containing protein n=1 Tax=Saccharomonospora cyanea NA-134 TaxID=882082 RepID=H5XG52_9PSEU|nr:hypothetical protein [Saccharomonospora cyanea]EHR62634.1 hypothetical protein SaccyDRAFT_3807 [Saccharomonospora cyanea NA-134]
MNDATTEARRRLETVLKGVDGVRYYDDPAGAADPPATVLSLPALERESGCPQWTTATFSVWVLHALDERAVERLPELATRVADALDELPEAVVTRATAMPFRAGTQELPSYEIEVEVAL